MPRAAQAFQAQGLAVNGAGRNFDVDVAAAERHLTFAAANRGQKIDPHGIGNVFAFARPFGAAAEALITSPAAAESRKNVVSSRNFLEFFGCRRIVLVDVGMIFACQLMIGGLDLRLGCAFGHA